MCEVSWLTFSRYLGSPQFLEEAFQLGSQSTTGALAGMRPPQLPEFPFGDTDHFMDDGAFWASDEEDSASFSYDNRGQNDTDSEKKIERDLPPDVYVISTENSAVSPAHFKDWENATLSGGRDMTIRLTLTRPDLLFQKNQQAFGEPYNTRSVGALPLARDRKALAESGTVRGLWRRFKSRK